MKVTRVFPIAATGMMLLAPWKSQGCAPMFPAARFVYVLGPVERAPFARGQLGLVLPTFYRRNLIVAYRYFSGIPLAQREIASQVPRTAPDAPANLDFQTPESAGRWLAARNRVPGISPLKELHVERRLPGGNQWEVYRACLDDAFIAAAATLQKRIEKWGATSGAVAEWVGGQDRVFQNCSGGAHLPPAVRDASNVLLRADRRYQIAAAEFYAEDFNGAERDFQAIAGDAASPWSGLAPYLVARTLIRRATLAADPHAMERAGEELSGILKDPVRRAIHAQARALAQFVRARLDPEGRMAEAGADLVRPGGDPHFDQDVVDFTMLWDKLSHGPAARCDLADWITAYQSRDQAGHSLERWRRSRNPAWLIAALESAGADDPAAEELLGAARALQPDQAAYATAVYWALAAESRRAPSAARAWADAALQSPQPADARNAFLARRQALARDWSEFLRYAPRVPVAAAVFQEDERPDDWSVQDADRPQFAADSVLLFNRAVPLGRWVDAAQNPLLPSNLQTSVAQAGWARAIVLGRQAEARALAARLAELQPALAPALREYLAEREPAAARFAAVFLMLRNPGFGLEIREGWQRVTDIAKIDNFGDNWWRLDRPAEHGPAGAQAPVAASYLPPLEQEQGKKEADGLVAAAAAAPDFLGQQALAWARQRAGDPRVPEALHLVVRATRFGSGGPNNSVYSKAAFQLLHTRYPKSRWTARTPYWY